MLKINLVLNSSPIKSIYEAVTIVNMNKYVRILMKFLPKISSWRQRNNFCARMANIGIWTGLKTQKNQQHWLANFVVGKNSDWRILWWAWFGSIMIILCHVKLSLGYKEESKLQLLMFEKKHLQKFNIWIVRFAHSVGDASNSMNHRCHCSILLMLWF